MISGNLVIIVHVVSEMGESYSLALLGPGRKRNLIPRWASPDKIS